MVIVARPKSKGMKTAQEKPKASTSKISAKAIAMAWPRCKSLARIGETSNLIAGGPVTRAPANECLASASRNICVYADAVFRSNEVPMLAYSVPAKAFSWVTCAPGISATALASALLKLDICSDVA